MDENSHINEMSRLVVDKRQVVFQLQVWKGAWDTTANEWFLVSQKHEKLWNELGHDFNILVKLNSMQMWRYRNFYMAESYIFQVLIFLSKFYINLKLMNYKTWIAGDILNATSKTK